MAPNPSAARNDDLPRTISVSGSGMVAVTPDMATVRVGVSSRDASPAKALKDNTARVTKLFKTLDTFGLEKRDIQTSSFNVNPVYTRRRPPNTPPEPDQQDGATQRSPGLHSLGSDAVVGSSLLTAAGADRATRRLIPGPQPVPAAPAVAGCHRRPCV